MVSRTRDSLGSRIERLIAAMDRLGVHLERASRGPSLATGPTKRMFDASHNEAATATTPASVTATLPAWKRACVIACCQDGRWTLLSPSESHRWNDLIEEWLPLGEVPPRKYGQADDRLEAVDRLDACPTPPPDWTEPGITAPEDVIDPSRTPVAPRGFSMDDVQEHRLCIVPPEKASYIRPTGKKGRYEHVWADGSVTPSAFSDGGLEQCLLSPSWKLLYEPRARELVGLPALADLDHCREV